MPRRKYGGKRGHKKTTETKGKEDEGSESHQSGGMRTQVIKLKGPNGKIHQITFGELVTELDRCSRIAKEEKERKDQRVKWDSSVPLPVKAHNLQIVGKKEAETNTQKQRKEKVEKREEERAFMQQDTEENKQALSKLQSEWDDERHEGAPQRMLHHYVLRAFFECSGLGFNYKLMRADKESYSAFSIEFKNRLGFAPLAEVDNIGVIPFFSLFHESRNVGLFAQRINPDWKWEFVSSEFFGDQIQSILDSKQVLIPEGMKKELNPDVVCIDTYSAMVIGLFSTLPLQLVAGQMSCNPLRFKIETLVQEFIYPLDQRWELYYYLKIILDNYTKFRKLNRKTIDSIIAADEAAFLKLGGGKSDEELFAELAKQVDRMEKQKAGEAEMEVNEAPENDNHGGCTSSSSTDVPISDTPTSVTVPRGVSIVELNSDGEDSKALEIID